METMMSYLDSMFAKFPDTDAVRKVKADMTAMMEDKYAELKAAGKSENEAIGTVISEFGNIDELAKEMGFDEKVVIKDGETESSLRKVSLDVAREYIQISVDIARKIATGVFLCICAPIALILFTSLAEDGIIFSEKLADLTGLIIMFSLVAIAVAIFIIYGVRLSKYEYLEKEIFSLEPGVENVIIKMREEEKGDFGIKIAVGVGLCIVSLIPLLVVEFIVEDVEWPTAMCTGFMFFLVAIAVHFFITAGMPHGRYSVLLQEGEYKQECKENHLIEGIASIYWPVVVAMYLGYSFITADWGRSWIIWPVAGVLFAAVSGICNLVKK